MTPIETYKVVMLPSEKGIINKRIANGEHHKDYSENYIEYDFEGDIEAALAMAFKTTLDE